MSRIRTSIYLQLFYFLMFISLTLLVVYECNYSSSDSHLEKDAIAKESVALSYLQSDIKKENSMLALIYSDIETEHFNKSAMKSVVHHNSANTINEQL